jgi:hypothetical protein
MLFLIKVEEISTMERQLNVLLGDFKSELSDWMKVLACSIFASMRG